jgi:hypothetical protein
MPNIPTSRNPSGYSPVEWNDLWHDFVDEVGLGPVFNAETGALEAALQEIWYQGAKDFMTWLKTKGIT